MVILYIMSIRSVVSVPSSPSSSSVRTSRRRRRRRPLSIRQLVPSRCRHRRPLSVHPPCRPPSHTQSSSSAPCTSVRSATSRHTVAVVVLCPSCFGYIYSSSSLLLDHLQQGQPNIVAQAERNTSAAGWFAQRSLPLPSILDPLTHTAHHSSHRTRTCTEFDTRMLRPWFKKGTSQR